MRGERGCGDASRCGRVGVQRRRGSEDRGAVDVALYDVATEGRAGRRGELEVDQRAGGERVSVVRAMVSAARSAAKRPGWCYARY